MLAVTRRRFLFVSALTTYAVGLAKLGTKLPRGMAAVPGDFCSFCGMRAEEVRGLAGAIGRPMRICDVCVQVCEDIIAEGLPDRNARSLELRCSFCDASRGAVRRLIAGPTVAICDDCSDDVRPSSQAERSLAPSTSSSSRDGPAPARAQRSPS